MPHSRIKQASIQAEIKNIRIIIKVYSINFQSKGASAAEKLLLKQEVDPVKFESIRVCKINQNAYLNDISLIT
jgi:hypothetical protein